MRRTTEIRYPKVRILDAVWKRLWAYIEACPMEVGGFGSIELRGDDLLVTDIFLIEQSATMVHIDFDGYSRFVGEWGKAGKDLSLLRFWWHSHAEGSCFWSHIDQESIDLLAKKDYLVSFVGNHRKESRVRLTVAQPIPIVIDDMRIEVVSEVDPILLHQAREEVRQKVRMQPHTLVPQESSFLGFGSLLGRRRW